MKKKRIVFLITGLYYGGMERVSFIAYDLLKDIYDVRLVALYTKDGNYKPSMEVMDLKCPPKKNKVFKALNIIKRTLAVAKMKKKLKPDLVISFGTSANFSNAITKKKDKTVLGIRSYDWLTNFFLSYRVDKWIYNKADIVSSVSKVIAEDAEKVFKINESKKRVLYNPYDVEFINQKSKEDIIDIRYDEEGPIFISVGRLVNQKGYNHLIKAFSLVVQDFPLAKLQIIGQGEKKDDLISLISELGVTENVTLIGPKENPYKYMKKADIYVLSSVTEGFPNAMVEAMALSLPILAVDCKSGPREILSFSNMEKKAEGVEKAEFGIITPEVSKSFNYDPKHIEECDYYLAEGMKLYLTQESLRDDYSKKSYRRAQDFTYEKFKSELISIFESI